MSQKFTILFDLDGTLVNTAPDLMLAHNYVMKKYGYGERKLSDIRKLAGRGSKVMLTRSMNELAEQQGKPKKSATPKSFTVSIKTNASPAAIPGRAMGKPILKKH